MRCKSSHPVDGAPFVLGLSTILKQLHPSVTQQVRALRCSLCVASQHTVIQLRRRKTPTVYLRSNVCLCGCRPMILFCCLSSPLFELGCLFVCFTASRYSGNKVHTSCLACCITASLYSDPGAVSVAYAGKSVCTEKHCADERRAQPMLVW